MKPLWNISYLFQAFFVLVILVVGCSSPVKESTDSDSEPSGTGTFARIVFDTTINDMGRIREGEQVIAWFDYTNSGDKPLVVQRINAGCGCTVPTWTKEPLQPGEEENLKVVFDSRGKKGLQNIKITVYSNAENSVEELRLKALVKDTN